MIERACEGGPPPSSSSIPYPIINVSVVLGFPRYQSITMALKGAETCRQCKQFRLMCLCPRGNVLSEGSNPQEKTLLSRQSSVTLHSLAIYQSTLKRQQSVKAGHKSPKNNPPAVLTEQIQERSSLVEAAHEPEFVQVSRPVPIGIKRKILLRLVEANYTTSTDATNIQQPPALASEVGFWIIMKRIKDGISWVRARAESNRKVLQFAIKLH